EDAGARDVWGSAVDYGVNISSTPTGPDALRPEINITSPLANEAATAPPRAATSGTVPLAASVVASNSSASPIAAPPSSNPPATTRVAPASATAGLCLALARSGTFGVTVPATVARVVIGPTNRTSEDGSVTAVASVTAVGSSMWMLVS